MMQKVEGIFGLILTAQAIQISQRADNGVAVSLLHMQGREIFPYERP